MRTYINASTTAARPRSLRKVAMAAALALMIPAASLAGAPAAEARSNVSYVALAESNSGRMVATGYGATKGDAILNAGRKASSGRDKGQPRILMWQQNGCVAYAESSSGAGWARSSSKSGAFRLARKSAGGRAHVTLSGCAGKYSS